MDFRKIWESTKTFKSKGLTFSERFVQNLLILGIMFGTSAVIVLVLFGIAILLRWVLIFIMPEFPAGITAMITTVIIAICVWGAAMHSED